MMMRLDDEGKRLMKWDEVRLMRERRRWENGKELSTIALNK